MNSSLPSISLPDEAKAVIWRIFGLGESHIDRRSAYELIEETVKEHASSIDTNRAIAEIRRWFESHGNQQWLKSEMSEPVAALILGGITPKRGEIAIWAVGSIDAEIAIWAVGSIDADSAVPIIHALQWPPKEIDSFVEAALRTLKKLCDQDKVLDAARISGIDSASAKIPEKFRGA